MHNFIKKEICHEKISYTCNHRNVAGFLYQFYSYISRNQPKGRFKRNHLFDIRNPWISWGCVALRNLGTRNFIEVAQKANIFQKALSSVTDTLTAVAESVKNILNNFIEAIAIMLITSCVIPILIVVIFVWIINSLTGLNITLPQPVRIKVDTKNKAVKLTEKSEQ